MIHKNPEWKLRVGVTELGLLGRSSTDGKEKEWIVF